MFKKFLFGGLIFSFVFFLSGCGQNIVTEKIIENQIKKNLGGDANVDLESGSVSIKNEDGSTVQVGGKVSLPEGFPSDVYVMDGELISAMKNVVGMGYQVSLKTDKKIEEINSLYEGKMKEDGWQLQQTLNMGDILMLSGKKDGRTMTVSVSFGGEEIDGNVVTLTLVEVEK